MKFVYKEGEAKLLWRPFDYKSLEDFKIDIDTAGVNIPLSDDYSVLRRPITIYGREISNRLAIQPCECFDAYDDGTPSELTFRRYRRYAAGGAGIIWFESCSPSASSKTSRWQCQINDSNVEVFSHLINEIHENAPATKVPFVILQMTHCGRNSRLDGDDTFPMDEIVPQYVPCHNPYVKKPYEVIVSDRRLKEIQDEYVHAAALAKEAGFDALDIRACHGYLISDLLSAFTRENSIYGGESFENRTRFLLETLNRVKAEVGIPLAIRINVCDLTPYPYGFGMAKDGSLNIDLTEPLKLLKILRDDIGIELFDISMGRTISPHIQAPYNKGPYHPVQHQLYSIEFYHQLAAMVKKEMPDSVIMTGTFAWARQYSANIAAGEINAGMYDIAGFARIALANPDFANDLFNTGHFDDGKMCVSCRRCHEMIAAAARSRCPVGCPTRDPEIYLPIYKEHVGDGMPIPEHTIKFFNLLPSERK